MSELSPLNVRVEPVLHEAAKFIAKQRGLTLTQYITGLIRNDLASENFENIADSIIAEAEVKAATIRNIGTKVQDL